MDPSTQVPPVDQVPPAENSRSEDKDLATLPHQWKSQPLECDIASLSLLRQSLLLAELSDIAYYAEEVAGRLAYRSIFPRFVTSNAMVRKPICFPTSMTQWLCVAGPRRMSGTTFEPTSTR